MQNVSVTLPQDVSFAICFYLQNIVLVPLILIKVLAFDPEFSLLLALSNPCQAFSTNTPQLTFKEMYHCYNELAEFVF